MQSPGYTALSTGWRLDTSGLFRAFSGGGTNVLDMAATGTSSVLKIGSAFNIQANGTANFSGAINVGAMTGYAWPAAGQSGAHLSSSGLLLGNFNGGGKYFQVALGGPGNEASISTNIPAYLADAQVTTLKIGANQVTVPVGAQNGSPLSYTGNPQTLLSVNLDSGGFPIFCTCTIPIVHVDPDAFIILRLYIGGAVYSTVTVYGNGSTSAQSLTFVGYNATPGSGSVNCRVTIDSFGTSAAWFVPAGAGTIFAIGAKR